MKGNNFTDMEIGKLIVIQEVIDGKKTGKQASNKLDLSERQIWRLVAKVKKQGNIGIKHGNCFNQNPKFITDDFKKHIIMKKRELINYRVKQKRYLIT